MDQTPSSPAPARQPELAPPGSPPLIVVPPSLLDQKHAVIRAENDSDEDYEARSRLLAAALAIASNG